MVFLQTAKACIRPTASALGLVTQRMMNSFENDVVAESLLTTMRRARNKKKKKKTQKTKAE